MTATVTEFEIIEALDFGFAPPCENTQGCDRTATWAVTLRCCGHIGLLCDGCTEKVREMDKFVGNGGVYGIQCNKCKNITWGPIVCNYERL